MPKYVKPVIKSLWVHIHFSPPQGMLPGFAQLRHFTVIVGLKLASSHCLSVVVPLMKIGLCFNLNYCRKAGLCKGFRHLFFHCNIPLEFLQHFVTLKYCHVYVCITSYISIPGMEYLLAGPEEAGTGHLLVTMQSVVAPWTPRLGLLISEGLRNGCPWALLSVKAGHTPENCTIHLSVDNSEKGLKISLDNINNGKLSKRSWSILKSSTHTVWVLHEIKTEIYALKSDLINCL